MESVHVASDVGIRRFETQAGEWVLVWAVGSVNSSGWSEIALVPRYYIDPPAGGIWDFDLVGSPPTGPVLPIILPITACGTFAAPEWCRGVRVHAATNRLDSSGMEIAALESVPEAQKAAVMKPAGRVTVRDTIAVFDDSFQPTGMCSMFSVRMKKLRHELTLVVEGPDEARIRACIAEAVGVGLIAAIVTTFPLGGGGLAAAIGAGVSHLKTCLGGSFDVRIDNRSHWIEWCT